jgi:hypothetical protein
LILNERGFDRAVAAGLRHVQYALPVTESFSERNQGVILDQAPAIGDAWSRARARSLRGSA